MRFSALCIGVIALLPAAVSAQVSVQSLSEKLAGYVSTLVPIVFALALIGFLWIGIKFLMTGGKDEKAVEQMRTAFIWGIVTLFVLASIWGIVKFLQTSVWGTSGPDTEIPIYQLKEA